TSHILAVDGYKVGLVASVVEGVLGLFLRSWLATIGTVIGLGLYAVLVGTSPSALRATIMGALYLIGRALGRPRDTLNGLAVAALLMTMINPFLPWHLAFQLSFVTTLGLAALVPIVERWLPRRRGLLQEGVREALGATAAAEIASAPLVITAFNHVSLVSLPVHAVVMPLLPMAIALSALTAVTGSLVPAVGNLLGLLAWIPLTAIIRVVHGAAALPGAALAIPRLGVEAVVTAYGVLGLVVLGRPNPLTGPGLPLADLWRRATATVPARVLVPALVLPCLLAGAILVSPPAPSERITMLEVDMGDAALIEMASGARIYIQADAGADQAARALGPMLPFWNRSLALGVLTLGDDRELAELTDLIGRLEMRRVIVPSQSGAAVSRDRLQEAARAARTEILRAEPGLHIRIGETDSLEIYPLDSPAAGARQAGSPSTLAVRLLLGRATILWISSDPADQARLAALGVPLSAQVLKLAGTGARWGVDPAFFARVNPSIVILPAGVASRFSRPTAGTLDLLAGRTVLRTDQDGTVVITAGENGLTVQMER
ncbi:MAG: ComEC/Rec2 family competence protein, partial [Chloroflexi bacterium]|nr:ComEC/Rec2 family competence protein [Chloroflexota bacterium]